MVNVINATTTTSSLVITNAASNNNSSSINTSNENKNNINNNNNNNSNTNLPYTASNSLILPQPYINTSAKFAKLAKSHHLVTQRAVALSDLGDTHQKLPSNVTTTSGLASSVISPSSTASSYSSSSSLSSSQTSLIHNQQIDSKQLLIESHTNAVAHSTTIMLAQELINYKQNHNHHHHKLDVSAKKLVSLYNENSQDDEGLNFKLIKAANPNLTALNAAATFKTSIRFKKVIITSKKSNHHMRPFPS
jgi:hypothetical protein